MSSDQGGAAGALLEGRRDLVALFHEAAASREGRPRLVGVEAEYLPVDPVSGEAQSYAGPAGVEACLGRLTRRGFTNADPGAAHVNRLTRGELSLNLEPGAQVEVSGTAAPSLAEAGRELAETARAAGESARELGFRLTGLGVQPVTGADEIVIVPKRRYGHMTRHFEGAGGTRWKDMMRRTASVQASFDYRSEREAGLLLRAALLAAPVAAAIFAHSAIAGGRPSGLLCERSLVWTDTDPSRQGAIAEVLDGAFAFERYVDYALRVPTILVRSDDGGVEPSGGAPFGALLERGAPSGRRLTRADWELHLTTIFTDARLKRVVECRPCDAQRPSESMSVPAFFAGLLYGRGAAEAALEVLWPLRGPLAGTRVRLDVARAGLAARLTPEGGPGQGARILDLARELTRIAALGLDGLGALERRCLAPVEARLADGRHPADRTLDILARSGLTAVIEDAAL